MSPELFSNSRHAHPIHNRHDESTLQGTNIFKAYSEISFHLVNCTSWTISWFRISLKPDLEALVGRHWLPCWEGRQVGPPAWWDTGSPTCRNVMELHGNSPGHFNKLLCRRVISAADAQSKTPNFLRDIFKSTWNWKARLCQGPLTVWEIQTWRERKAVAYLNEQKDRGDRVS